MGMGEPDDAWYERNGIAFQELCDLLSDIGEDCYCASWLIDIEHSVWAMLGSKEPIEFGMGSVSPADLERAEALGKAIGGWARYEQGPRFVPADEWVQRHAEWMDKTTPKQDEKQFPWARRATNG